MFAALNTVEPPILELSTAGWLDAAFSVAAPPPSVLRWG
jgi:hypothetical protein